MKKAVKSHAADGLLPANGFGNDENRVTLCSTGSLAWGIQYWIEKVEQEMKYSLYISKGDCYLTVIRHKSKKEVESVLRLVAGEDLVKWRVSGETEWGIDRFYMLANDFLAQLAEEEPIAI
jgi:hypothetical protein